MFNLRVTESRRVDSKKNKNVNNNKSVSLPSRIVDDFRRTQELSNKKKVNTKINFESSKFFICGFSRFASKRSFQGRFPKPTLLFLTRKQISTQTQPPLLYLKFLQSLEIKMGKKFLSLLIPKVWTPR